MRLVSKHTLATLLYVGGIVGRLQTIEASPSVHRPVLAILRTRARTPVRAAWVGSVLPDKPKGGDVQSVGNPRYSENAKDANLLTSVQKDEYTTRGSGPP